MVREAGAAKYGERLIELVDAKVKEIAAAPESFPIDTQRAWARRARILKSPYTLIFAVHEGVNGERLRDRAGIGLCIGEAREIAVAEASSRALS